MLVGQIDFLDPRQLLDRAVGKAAGKAALADSHVSVCQLPTQEGLSPSRVYHPSTLSYYYRRCCLSQRRILPIAATLNVRTVDLDTRAENSYFLSFLPTYKSIA